MKVCSFCGTEMPDESNFCPYCGLKVTDEGITSDYYQNLYEKGVPNVPDDYVNLLAPKIPQMSEEDKQKQKKTLIITAIVTTIVIFVVALFCGLYFGGNSKAEEALVYKPGKLSTQGDNQVYLNETLDIKFVCPKDWDCKLETEFETKTSGHVEFSGWYEDRIGTFVSYSWEYKEDAQDEYESWVDFINSEKKDMILEKVEYEICGRPFVGYIRANGMGTIGSIEMQLYGDAPQGYVVNIDVFAKDKEEALEVLSHYE
ncbi:MAG: zinc-ribbon domain-containing protein [Clostridia bacterium]|nr:zinc-ribbon domain-containing protein [Clostridia bacterium]